MVEESPSTALVLTETLKKYFVDFDAYPERNRSRAIFLRERMCEESRGGGAPTPARGRAQAEAVGRGVRFNTRRGQSSDDPLAIIVECCAGKPEYRDPRLPLKEILFRLILANANQPMGVEELRAQASDWTGFEYGGGITDEAVQHLLTDDAFYGFKAA